MTEELEGVVESLLFSSEESGYSVVKLRSGGQLFTAVGNLGAPVPGERLHLKGHWSNHPRFGRQFAVEAYESHAPATVEGIERYLASGLIPGIGSRLAGRIVRAFGEQTLEILDVVVPRAEIANHVKRVQEVSEELDIWLPTFGHAADGNVHTHIMKARYANKTIVPLSEEEWKDKLAKVREELYRDCKKREGYISGEHGIGVVKKPYLSYVLSEEEISLMRGIKDHFDPNHILNPGKIFD